MVHNVVSYGWVEAKHICIEVFKIKVAFFDRDGTIIKDYPDNKWSDITHPEFIPGSVQTLRKVQALGYEIIIITNQYLINEGYITYQHYKKINRLMINDLFSQGVKVLDVFYCPHSRGEGCCCIKPQPGMIREAIKKHPDIDLSKSFMIGDSKVDIDLAINMNISGFGIGINAKDPRIKKIDDVKDVISYIK